jgi:DNA-binding response OmpR family regulator
MSQHILVVDDEEQIRELLCVYLMKQGFQVTTAATSDETLKLLKENPVDLVVLDIGLAEEDGLRLLGQIKQTYPHIRVVMLTGMGFVEDLLQEAHQKGADGYVSKVLPLDELLMAIQRTFRDGDMPELLSA